MTAKELFDEGIKLLNSKNYTQLIKLLTETKLSKYTDANLYFLKGQSFNYLGDKNEAIKCFSKAIKTNQDYFPAYNDRGAAYTELQKFDLALNDYNKAIELEYRNPTPYMNRAIVYKQLKKYLEAKSDYDKAVRLSSKDSSPYYNRGLFYNEVKNYKEAIKNFNKAIQLNPNDVESYISRGSTYINIYKNREAVVDFNKAIELNPNNEIAFYNRGVLYHNIGDYKRALQDYNAAIELHKDFAVAYNNRGLINYKLNKYEEALKDYRMAIELNAENIDQLKYRIDIIKTLLGKNIANNKKGKESFYYFVELINKLAIYEERKIKIKQKCAEIMTDVIEKIQEYASDCNDVTLTHYTKLKVADIITSEKEGSLRYYNAVHMNDPEEGKILLEYLNDGKLKDAFMNGKIGEENNIYIGSFLPAQEHEDELIMWRTYGKDENKNEAAGCSIIIDSNFFDKERNFLNTKIKVIDTNESRTADSFNTTQCLYKVIYLESKKIDKNDDIIIALLNNLKTGLNELLELKYKNSYDMWLDKDLLEKETDWNVSKIIDKIIFQMISEIRYFFKSSDYSFENEFRVIQFVSPDKKTVIIDKDSDSSLPRRLYINSNKAIQPFIKKIILGPKVPLPDQWIYLEVAMRKNGYEIEVVNSKCKYQ